MEELKFDTVIHLAGEQTIPNCMAMKLTECSCHVFLTTAKTKRTVGLIRNFFGNADVRIEEFPFPADGFSEMVKAVSDIADRHGHGLVGVNVTGGTKPMFAAVLDMCRKHGFTPFYVDTEHRCVQVMNPPFQKIEMPPIFSSVSDFVRLAGFEVNDEGARPLDVLGIAKRRFLRLAWQHREVMQRHMEGFANAIDKRHGYDKNLFDKANSEFEGTTMHRADRASLWSEWKTCAGEMGNWRRAAEFAAGGWFEEWLLKTFSESKNSDKFIDLRKGLRIRAPHDTDSKRDVQEIDLIYTDGYELYVIECKAGKIIQDHVQKLENLSKQLGGIFGHGILCSINSPDQMLQDRVSLGSIASVSGEALERLPKCIGMVRPRKCYSANTDFAQ